MTEVDLIKRYSKQQRLSFTFNDYDFSELLTIEDVDRVLLPSRNNKLKHYQRVRGSRLLYTRLEHSVIKVKFNIIAENLIAVRRRLSVLLNVDEPKKLVFSDEPDKFYLAIINGDISMSSVAYAERGTIQFLVLDGVAYSNNEKVVTQTTNKLVFNNLGTAPTYPTFEFTVQNPLKMIALVHPNGNTLQYGSETSDFVLRTNDVVKIDTSAASITVNGNKRYFTGSSKSFLLETGKTEIGVVVNVGSTLPTIIGKIREAWL